MVTSSTSMNSISGLPPVPPTPPPTTSTVPAAPVSQTNATYPPPQPTSPPSTTTQSVAMQQTNGTDQVQISSQALNANQGGTPPSPPQTSMNTQTPYSTYTPGGTPFPTAATQTQSNGTQQSGRFVNMIA